MALKLRLRKGQWGDAYSELRFRNANKSESLTSFLTMREAYVKVYLGAFDLRIGQLNVVEERFLERTGKHE